MATTTEPAGKAFFDRIPATTNEHADECRALYDDWASTYDDDLTDASHGYVGPVEAAKAIVQNCDKGRLTVLDAGCGTGLSGVAVKNAVGNDVVIDGIDISTGMLDIARKKNVYQKLEPADLSKTIQIPDNSYDAVVCVGTLTGGHVGPTPALSEFVRVVKRDGIVVATIKDSGWASDGYEAEVQRMKDARSAQVVSADLVPYRQAQGVDARLLIMRKP
jgi:predicted TPR repeat methyltransferase